jgi:hypothetical protein
MDNLEQKVMNSGPTFFNHMFNLDEETKETLLNVGQYSLLSMLPVVGLNKLCHNIFPEADEDKVSYLILFEIVSQVLVVLAGIFYINRFATYFSPFSKKEYDNINILNVVILLLIIIFSFQTKVGEKVSILYDRIMGYWEGDKKEDKKQSNVKVTQPISGQSQASAAQHGPLTMGDASRLLPQQMNTDNPLMYQQQQQPQQQMQMEPMAANEGFGGFSSF